MSMDVSRVDPEEVLVDYQTVEPGDVSGDLEDDNQIRRQGPRIYSHSPYSRSPGLGYINTEKHQTPSATRKINA
ncbi:hypothetical protein F5J12DRAFT_888332 [Pisolithus orientalis]|uniref:uncharacterized protein n=1 Tax=Pisolithus orientalis TaxID=936130 RepID=UPI0022249BE7|nr:uncharacterized protein F5J12DRAFT_888332 [Pisolithus orientalis]KAI6030523.1 hypothetical protein F5J12DRAFT_888332 [Pisolithus orientalis]